MIERLKIGIAQINPTVGDFSGNQEKILDKIEEAENREMDWIVFPEVALCGYPVWDLAVRKNFVREGLRRLDAICRKTKGKKVVAMLGYIEQGPAGTNKNYNALAVVSGGEIIHKQYKMLLPNYDVFLEQIFFHPAQKQNIFNYRGTRVGLSICEDIWDENYPVKPVKTLVRQGAKLIVNISASPFHRNIGLVRERLVSRKAREAKAHLIYVNQVGGQDDLVFDGRSLVADPDGNIVFRGDAFREALYEVEIDLRRKPGRSLSSRSPSKEDPVQDMYEALVLGVRDYVRKNGFSKVVIGLSGGIDSALTAVIAADALGPEKVVGVAMPGDFSSKDSLEDAAALANSLGIKMRIRPICEIYREFIRKMIFFKESEGQDCAERHSITLAMENLQARLRGMGLMYISNDEAALLLSTGNKSELATGYCTLYGDMSGGLCVLGDVYKSDVYRLSRYRNGVSEVIPRRTLGKAPTAELRPNQKDQDTLPPYDVLDRILNFYIEKNLGKDEILRKLSGSGISGETIEWVINRVERNEYKRRQAPPILRVTEKAWFGRRMPITNHFRG